MYEWLGTSGLYLTAGVSGVSDVDAITLSLAKMAYGNVEDIDAGRGIVIAALVNTLLKGVIAVVIGGRSIAYFVLPVFAPIITLGIVGMFFYGFFVALTGDTKISLFV